MKNSTAIVTQPAPDSLILPSGQVQYGHFDGPAQTLGLANFRYFDCMDKPAGWLANHFHFKQFQFVSVKTARYLIGVAIADIRYVGSAFCYLYDIKANRLVEATWLKALGMGYKMSDSPVSGEAKIASGKGHISFKLLDGQWQISLETALLSAQLSLEAPALSLPMAMCNPTGYSGWTYTQKHNGLKVKGSLSINHEPQPLNCALAGYDFSAGYMRRETSWRWASINAQVGESTIGLNLAAGVNETGCNENVFWVDGERHLLGPVQFEFSRQKSSPSQSSWRISGNDGQIELQFNAKNCRQEKLNLWLIKSNFRQYIGYFDGFIIDNKGRKHELARVLGLTEDHFARW
ncbi:DUF2804 domain-containing protein [Shewanella colwelliana]|uniref:DUF2804 domain-containing protein n=1 Tax=Shewanella colwelliana TaxID=23 RepID=UPI0022AF481F|nr:DUF2804 domain-containing protein [Shewanella colwelliana]MCZ4337450.1 DUF2804 domain-containing protein [Shewanella colwelliana]